MKAPTGIIEVRDRTTPSNPVAGFRRLYTKSDGKLYALSSTGTESMAVYDDDARLTDTRTPSNDANLVHLTGDETLAGIKTLTSETVHTSTNAHRHVQGNYGALMRMDSNFSYYLLTASGDQYGSFNALRPLTIAHATGLVTMGNGLTLSNGLTLGSWPVEWTSGSGLPTFNTRSAGVKIILSGPVNSIRTDYGIGLASSTMWFGVPNSASKFQWYAGEALVATLSGTGVLTVDRLITGTDLEIAEGGTGGHAVPTAGGVIYGVSASAYGATPAGSSGQVLTSRGAAIPTWEDDTLPLDKLNQLTASDQHLALAKQQRDREDGVQYIEKWATFTSANWNTVTHNQISGGKLYGLGTTQSPAGSARPMSVPKGSKFRITSTVNWVTGGGNYVMFGLCKNAAPLAVSAVGAVMWGVTVGGQPVRFNNGAVTGYASANMTAVEGSTATTSTWSYTVCIVGDENGISVSLTQSTHSVEWTDYIPWSAVVSDFVSACLWVNDTRALSGSSIGPMLLSTSSTTAVPRATIEDATEWVVTAVDAAGDNMRICLPTNYDSRVPSPVIMYYHGGAGSETEAYDPAKRTMMQTLSDAGYIIASTNGAGFNWGNSAGLLSYLYLYRYLRDHFAIGPIHHLGQSMGGLASTLSMASRGMPAASLALIYPVTNLAALYANPTFTSVINTAYGIPGSGTYAARTAGHDPNLMPGKVFRGLPIWATASYADVTVNRVANLDAFVTNVTPFASEITTRTSTGLHGDATNFDAATATSLLAFFDRHNAASGA